MMIKNVVEEQNPETSLLPFLLSCRSSLSSFLSSEVQDFDVKTKMMFNSHNKQKEEMEKQDYMKDKNYFFPHDTFMTTSLF